jgi:hypothetical protein
MPIRILHALALTMMASMPATAATVVFSERFDAENGGASALDFAGFSQFTVVNGTVDLIASGSFGIACAGGAGACVDLDGSSGNAGRIDSAPIAFAAGTIYRLTFDVSGNQRGGLADTLTFGITSGLIVPTTIMFAPSDPFRTVTATFQGLGGTPNSLFFENGGGDNLGAILDNVAVEALDGRPAPIPLPASLPLLAGALGAVVWTGRRRARRQGPTGHAPASA